MVKSREALEDIFSFIGRKLDPRFLGKSIANLYGYAEISKAANNRFLFILSYNPPNVSTTGKNKIAATSMVTAIMRKKRLELSQD